MLEQLLDLVKGMSGDAVVNNPVIPNERNEEVMADATHSIFTGLQNITAGGGTGNVLSLLGGKDGNLLSNPIVQMIIGVFTKKLLSKFNMAPAQANSIAGGLIPNVISSLVSKTNDPNNSTFDLNGIMNSLAGGGGNTGGGGFNFQNILGSLTSGGLDQNKDGNVDLQDAIAAFTGGAQQQIQQQNSNGGVTGLLQNLLGAFK